MSLTLTYNQFREMGRTRYQLTYGTPMAGNDIFIVAPDFKPDCSQSFTLVSKARIVAKMTKSTSGQFVGSSKRRAFIGQFYPGYFELFGTEWVRKDIAGFLGSGVLSHSMEEARRVGERERSNRIVTRKGDN